MGASITDSEGQMDKLGLDRASLQSPRVGMEHSPADCLQIDHLDCKKTVQWEAFNDAQCWVLCLKCLLLVPHRTGAFLRQDHMG